MDRRLIHILVLGLTLPTLSCVAQSRQVPRWFDHTIYIHVDSTPSGADIYAVSSISNKIGRLLGVAPCMTIAGLKWEEKFGRKKWGALNVWSAGDACRAEYNKKDKTFDIFFSCAAVRQGYHATNVEMKITTLEQPGFGWDIPDTWPREINAHVTLAAKETKSVSSATPVKQTKRSGTRRVILASSSNGQFSGMATLSIRANVKNAKAYVDGKPVGTTPVDVLLPEGAHDVLLRQKGYAPFRKTVRVRYDTTTTVKAELTQK